MYMSKRESCYFYLLLSSFPFAIPTCIACVGMQGGFKDDKGMGMLRSGSAEVGGDAQGGMYVHVGSLVFVPWAACWLKGYLGD